MLCFFKHFTSTVIIIKQQLNFPCFLAVVLSTVTLLCLNFQIKAGMIKFKEQFHFGNILIWKFFNIWKYFYPRQCLKKTLQKPTNICIKYLCFYGLTSSVPKPVHTKMHFHAQTLYQRCTVTFLILGVYKMEQLTSLIVSFPPNF